MTAFFAAVRAFHFASLGKKHSTKLFQKPSRRSVMKIHLLFAALLIAAPVTPAFAHAHLSHSEPGANTTVAEAPKQLVLTFTEQLEPSFSGVTITDGAGHDMGASPAKVSGAVITVALKPLVQGTYKVVWHAVSVDTHRTEGDYSFTIKP
jgi:methionine-rich copper-binding protein CopC